MKLNLVVIKNKQVKAEEPFIFLLTNYNEPSDIEQVAQKYADRWKKAIQSSDKARPSNLAAPP
jgi:proline dehydrogenase